MKSWEARLLANIKVADFAHPASVFLHSALPSFPPPLRPFHFSHQFLTSALPAPKPPGWPCARSMSVLGRKSYRADVRHLISYRRKLLCEINTRPSVNPCTHTCMHIHTYAHTHMHAHTRMRTHTRAPSPSVISSAERSWYGTKTSRLPSSSSSKTCQGGLVVDCLIARGPRCFVRCSLISQPWPLTSLKEDSIMSLGGSLECLIIIIIIIITLFHVSLNAGNQI